MSVPKIWTGIRKHPFTFRESFEAVVKLLVSRLSCLTRSGFSDANMISDITLTSAPVSTKARIPTFPISICNLIALSVWLLSKNKIG